MPLLALNSISKRFGAHQALQDVSLAVEPGEVLAIIGRSGSGKSTLLRCVNGLERPDSGTIEFDGKAFEPTPRRLKALRREIGIVFQSYNLFPHLCVEPGTAFAAASVCAHQRAPRRVLTRGRNGRTH
jgi:polar amino acid transport system ATP-binding protein